MVSPKTDDRAMTSAAMFCSTVNTCFDEVNNNHFIITNEFWSQRCQSKLLLSTKFKHSKLTVIIGGKDQYLN